MNQKLYFLLLLIFCLTVPNAFASNKADEIALRKAARAGDYTRIMDLVQNKVAIDAVDENGWTALIHACKNEQIDIARLLIEQKAQVDGVEAHAPTPLAIALETKSDELVSLLLFYRADVTRNLPLHNVVQRRRADLLELVAERGAPLNIVDNTGKTLLHSAVLAKDSYIASYLIEHQIDVVAEDLKGRTAFDYAYAKQNEDMMRVLIHEGKFPLSRIKIIDAKLYKDIKTYGLKVINGWFASQKTTNEFRFVYKDPEPSMSKEVWIATGAVGILVIKLLHYVLQRGQPQIQAHPVPAVDPAAVIAALSAMVNQEVEKAKNVLKEAASNFFIHLMGAMGTPMQLERLGQCAAGFLEVFKEQQIILNNLADNFPEIINREGLLASLTQTYFTLVQLVFMDTVTNYIIATGEDLVSTHEAAVAA